MVYWKCKKCKYGGDHVHSKDAGCKLFKKPAAAKAAPAPAPDLLPSDPLDDAVEPPPGLELPLPKLQDCDNPNVVAPVAPVIQDSEKLRKKAPLVPFKLHAMPNFKLRDAIAKLKTMAEKKDRARLIQGIHERF